MPTGDRYARAVLLMLADGRFPAGGYAHSGGLEPAITQGSVRTVADLELFLAGRLRTAGFVAAAFAAAAAARTVRMGAAGSMGSPAVVVTSLPELDEELDARTPSPAQRSASRALGRQLVRAATEIAPAADLADLPVTPHHPIALGAVHAALGLGPADAALACLHEVAAGPVTAAARLLHIDPFAGHGVLAGLGPMIDALAEAAVERSAHLDNLPADTGPLLDTNAERHQVHRARLFAS